VTSVPGGQRYGALVASLRALQDAYALADPDEEVAAEAIDLADRLTSLLRSCQVDESRSPAGKRPDLPGRGSLFLLPVVADEVTDDRVRAHVVFGDFYRGGRSDAAHGGAHALLFDEVVGKLVARRGVHRTAYLHVDYRAVLPVGTRLEVAASIGRVEGRKVFARGEIRHGDVLIAEAEGLWVKLRPGQL
jgi:acyl-coenzyme A thioesterase PaaI-like protein